MSAIILAITVLCYAAQSILQKMYQEAGEKKTKGSLYAFNIYMAFAALLVFVCLSKGIFVLHLPTLWFGVAFGVCYSIAFLFTMLAIKNGSMSLTALIVSYSLIIPATYGVMFLHETLKLTIVAGIGLLFCSLFLVNKSMGKIVVTKKWSFFAGLAFVGNGGCATVQKIHQVTYGGAYKSELMISALLLVLILFSIMFIACRDQEKYKAFGQTVHYPILSGICNGFVNLAVMLLSVKMPAVLLFPVISGGGIIITYFTARFLFKEQLSGFQKAGFLLGTLSVIVMNL